MKHFDPLNPDGSKKVTDRTVEQKLRFEEVSREYQVWESMFGLDTASITGHEQANSILHKTPEEFCKAIPEEFRILHIKSVVRGDRVNRFHMIKSKIRNELSKFDLKSLKPSVKYETRKALGRRQYDKEALIDVMVEPEVTFHCTREDFIPSIIRHGFLKPEEDGDIRCGNTYGRLL